MPRREEMLQPCEGILLHELCVLKSRDEVGLLLLQHLYVIVLLFANTQFLFHTLNVVHLALTTLLFL